MSVVNFQKLDCFVIHSSDVTEKEEGEWKSMKWQIPYMAFWSTAQCPYNVSWTLGFISQLIVRS